MNHRTDHPRQPRAGRRPRAGHRRPVRVDVASTLIWLGVVALLLIGGAGPAPTTQAAPPPADRVSHGAAGTARNGVGGSIAPSPTSASWPGTGNDRNGGPFAFIGAQYGSLWSIPASSNNSLGVGYCVMEDVGGEGVVSLQPDPALWDASEMAKAAALMSTFGGDRVVPYGIDASGPYDVASGEWAQPTLFGAGEYTRRRHVAVNFGVKMFVEDVSPSGVAAGRKLARDSAVVDGSGDNYPALRAGYDMAQRLTRVAEIQHAVGGVRLDLQWDTSDGEAPRTPGTYALEVRVTDAAGKPVGLVPVVQVSEVGLDGKRSIGAVAAHDASTSTGDDDARRAAAVATGWPTMDMAQRMADDDRFLLGAAPASAAVTDTDGSARFDVTIDRERWELGFHAQAPTDDVSLYAGTGIQGQITWTGPPQSATAHQVAPAPLLGLAAVRKVIEPADLAANRDLSGFEFVVTTTDGARLGADGGDLVARTDELGVTPPVELPAGRYRVTEAAVPDWADALVDTGPIEFDLQPDGTDTIAEVAYTNLEPTATIVTAASDADDGDQIIDLTLGDATIVDRVTYTGLVPGTAYVAAGELMLLTAVPPGADAATEPMATGIVGSTSFTADASAGSVDVLFVVPADTVLAGHALVAYQHIEVEGSGRRVATHHDPAALEQTIWLPFVSTTLLPDRPDAGAGSGRAANGPVHPGDALIDHLTAYGLRPDRRYRTDLTLHERLADGTCVATDVAASTVFDVPADVPSIATSVGGFDAPHTGAFVAFQVISMLDESGERVVARHADCDSVTQRIDVVDPPAPTPTTVPPSTTSEPSPTTSVATTPSPTSAPTPTAAPAPRTVGTLSRTGTDASTALAAVGLALLGIGVALITVVRRPRTR